jgi:GDP-L-fucose synthase
MKLYIAGRFGMVGSALSRLAVTRGYNVKGKSSQDLDLRDRLAVFKELKSEKPDALVIAAAKVGGIGANSSYPVDFLSFNLQIQTNLIDAAHAVGIDRVLFLGSSCIYPKFAPQPIRESALLTGELEPTNEPLASAKIAGIKLISAYRKQYGRKWFSVMPSNLYGPGDNFNLENEGSYSSIKLQFNIKIYNLLLLSNFRLSSMFQCLEMSEFRYLLEH